MRIGSKLKIIASLILLSFFSGLLHSEAASFERIFYYRNTEAGKESLHKNYATIDVLAPQWYAFGATGALESEADQEVSQFARSKGIDVMPLLVNKSFSQKGLAILSNEVALRAAIIALTTEAKKMGYIGYQVDFEQMDVSYKDKFTAFVSKLRKGLNDNGLILSVAVFAKISDNESDYKPGLYNKVIAVYDYSKLAEASDFVSVMSYDDPGSKGPVARQAWLEQVVSYSLRHIPKEKISLGIPLYYWKWNSNTQKLVGIGGYEGLKNAFARVDKIQGYSPTEKSAFLSYKENGYTYMVWYEDKNSLPHKLSYITSNELRGFSAWVLGLEVPEVHKIL